MPWLTCGALVLSVGAPGLAQTPAAAPACRSITVLGQVESVDAGARSLVMKAADGSSLSVTLAEKGTVVKVAPGETSLANAAPIAFDAITSGDRVMVRGGARNERGIDGALRVVVMARTDLAARNEAELRAWRERGVSGTLISADPTNREFILQTAAAPAAPAAPGTPASGPAAPNTVVVDATKAVIHRYADTSIKFDDARPSTVAEMEAADQIRVLGTRAADGRKITAERVVFGHFSTRALAIEKIDAASGVISVKDLQSNQKFTLTVSAGGTIRKIPAEMAAMFGGGAPGGGRPGMGGGGGQSGAPGGAMGGGQAGAPGGPPGGAMGGARPNGARPGGGRGGRGMEDMVERMPAITLADLKKDDWIGAVVGRIDASGKAVAFNVLAGIEVFASRANRSGGVDVGMPAGLLDGAFGMQ
jgi:hypothetical protein